MRISDWSSDVCSSDLIDRPFFKQKLGTLEAFRKFFTYGLLDHAWTGKTDQGMWFSHDDIAHKGKTGRHATHGGIGQDTDEGQTSCRPLRQHGIDRKSTSLNSRH